MKRQPNKSKINLTILFMKKIFTLMCALAVVFSACTSNEMTTEPSVSFETAVPVISDGTATFKIVVAEYEGTEAVSIPVTFGGTAVRGTDYSVSADAFVVGGDAPVTEIVVTALVYGKDADVMLTLDLPQGWKSGNHPTSSFKLPAKLGWVSFVNKKAGMTDKASISIGVYDSEGKSLNLTDDDNFTVSVNTEESTAVEGTHFSFDGEKIVNISAGQSSGVITLNMIGDAVVEGCDKLVLELDPGSKYDLGANRKVTITILGSEWNRLAGEWQISEMLIDAESLRDSWDWGNSLTGYEFIPSYDSNGDGVIDLNVDDKIVFDTDALTLTPSFKSTFKNFFLGVSNITPAGPFDITVGGQNAVTNWNPDGYVKGYVSTPALLLDNTNRYFSPTAVSEDKESYIAYGIKKDEENNDVLLIYFIDVTPKESYFPEWTAHMFNTDPNYEDDGTWSWIYNTTKPFVTDNFPSFLIASFKKVK